MDRAVGVAPKQCIWQDPSSVPPDLVYGPGGRDFVPTPPFTFVQEHLTGSQPCVGVRDARGRLWRVKWGNEARPEAFASRFAQACGYFAEVSHFISSGTLEGATSLARAAHYVDSEGRFVEARFELEDPTVRMLFNEYSWAWDDNPFVGTPQLTGLKVIVMLLSNWDTKDRRDAASNTAIFEVRRSPSCYEVRYLVSDWGAALGRWGNTFLTLTRWDPDGFAEQTPSFVGGTDGAMVQFGYEGRRTEYIARDIPVDHVRWLCPYLGRLTETQLRDGLVVSGATPDEAAVFARALLDRIAQLRDL